MPAQTVLVIDKYKNIMKDMISISYPNLTKVEISNVMDKIVDKSFKDHECQVNNNYTNKNTDMYLGEFTNYVLEREPICCSSGVMFKKHGTTPNPLAKMIQMFMDNRGIHKKEMFKYPKGSEMFEKFNLLQLLDKIDCNAIYGVLGQPTALFYNIHVASSITSMGRTCISSATMFFEMFLSNNVKFSSLDEIIHFIHNVIGEKGNRKYKDSEILDHNISREECFSKIVYTIGDFRKGRVKWLPSENELDILWDIISKLDQEDVNRLYYKNNLYEFMDNTSMGRSLVYILKKLKTPFMNPNEAPDEIKVELDILLNILKEYVYYQYQIMDRVDRCNSMIKNVACISDTDSAIVSLDAWYNFALQKIQGIPMDIKKIYMNPVELLDDDCDGFHPVSFVEEYEDYDFISDDIINKKKLINPVTISPQEGVRYSVINIMAYIIGELVNDYMINLTKTTNSYSENRKCMIYMKNEFLFKRVLLTSMKKNYASIQEIQEGNLVPKDKSLDIKGLPINKSTLNKNTRDKLKAVLYEDILECNDIDQVKVIKDLAKIEKKIFKSLESGSKDYYKPLSIKALSSYDDPMRIQGVKASVIWNYLKDDDLESIDLTARNTIDIVKVNITEGNRDIIKDKYPDIYNKLVECMNDKTIFKETIKDNFTRVINNNITSIAIPIDVETPKWIMEFIDYKSIINNNIKTFPLDSINVRTLNNDNVNYTNIMKI